MGMKRLGDTVFRLQRDAEAYERIINHPERYHPDDVTPEKMAGYKTELERIRPLLAQYEAEYEARTPKPEPKVYDLRTVTVRKKSRAPQRYGIGFDGPAPKGSSYWAIFLGKSEVGCLLLVPNPETMTASLHSVIYSADNQRKGIGSVAYNKMEEMLRDSGYRLVPSEKQTDAAKAFWAKRQQNR